VSSAPQRNLILILARDFASRLATAVVLVDAKGNLVYFNEAAERVLRRTYVEAETADITEWAASFTPMDEQGNVLPLSELPLGHAIEYREPAHDTFWIDVQDGPARRIEVTSFPLFATEDEMVGAVAVFWEPEGS
jgi:PAS domain-containing protein